LKIMTETAEVDGVNPGIHEAEAIGRADNCIAGDFQDRAMMNLNELQVPAESPPRRCE
jgi:hypothetical protein